MYHFRYLPESFIFSDDFKMYILAHINNLTFLSNSFLFIAGNGTEKSNRKLHYAENCKCL